MCTVQQTLILDDDIHLLQTVFRQETDLRSKNFSFIKPQLRVDAFREYTFALCSYQVLRVSDVLFVPENKEDIWWDFNELE